MNATLNDLGVQLFELLGQMSVELAALAVFVLLVGRALRTAPPVVRHLLWVAVLLKPIIAVTISSPWTLPGPLAWFGEGGWSAAGYAPWALSAIDPLATMGTSPVAGATVSQLTIAGWVAAVWALGVALLMGRLVVGYGVIRRLRRDAEVHSDGPLVGALQRARLALGVDTRAEVATSASIRSPIVLGILRPLIVVPVDLARRQPPDDLMMVLMHELAHVRRYDNLTLLLQRLVSAVLFFHPVVWLCGRMLQREAEQASDDLVVCATGRSEDYARGLASVVELAHLRKGIPMMNVFAATESDLVLRIRRAIGGNARRMSATSRVLTAIVLCGVLGLALPSCDKADNSMSTDLTAARIAEEEAARVEGHRERLVWEVAMATDPDEWSDGLKAQMLALKPPGTTIEEIAKGVRQRKAWQTAMSTPPGEWSGELKEQLLALKPGATIEEIAEGIRQSEVWKEARADSPDEWSDELKAELLALKPGSTIEEIADGVRQRERARRLALRSRRRAMAASGIEGDAGGTLSPVDEQARKTRTMIAGCYTIGLVGNPALAGTVTVRFTIGTDGKVGDAAVSKSTIGNSDVESCIVRVVGTWTFAGGSPTETIEFPFTFGPGSLTVPVR